MRFPTFILSVAFATAAFAAPTTYQTIDFTNKSIESGTGMAGGGIVIISNTQDPDESTLIAYCDSGYTLSGTGTNAQCISTKSVIYYCDGGDKVVRFGAGKAVRHLCPTTEYQCRYNPANGVSVTLNSGWCNVDGTTYWWNGRKVSSSKYTKGEYVKTFNPQNCQYPYKRSHYKICGEALVHRPAKTSCPSGYNQEGDKCRKYRLPKYKSSN